MESLWLLIPLSIVIAIVIGIAFWWSVESGQLDDLDSPGVRVLLDDDRAPQPTKNVTGATARKGGVESV